ncbi:MAG: hypothetical protein HY094_08410 [Candidatus Melainabacteria bacterium]|nr:hypothetical protein [Candidatus Melainabacteria bacterium]
MTTAFLDKYQGTAWKHTDIFDMYETARRFTRPALRKTAREAILPNIQKGGVVLERPVKN